MADGSAHSSRRPAWWSHARRGLLVAIGVLYVLSVPWYRDTDAGLSLWLGLPDWATVAILCYAAAAFLNAGAWLLTDVDDADPLPPVLRGAGGEGAAGGGAPAGPAEGPSGSARTVDAGRDAP
jgi:hypothetical protein